MGRLIGAGDVCRFSFAHAQNIANQDEECVRGVDLGCGTSISDDSVRAGNLPDGAECKSLRWISVVSLASAWEASTRGGAGLR